MGNKLAKQNC